MPVLLVHTHIWWWCAAQLSQFINFTAFSACASLRVPWFLLQPVPTRNMYMGMSNLWAFCAVIEHRHDLSVLSVPNFQQSAVATWIKRESYFFLMNFVSKNQAVLSDSLGILYVMKVLYFCKTAIWFIVWSASDDEVSHRLWVFWIPCWLSNYLTSLSLLSLRLICYACPCTSEFQYM